MRVHTVPLLAKEQAVPAAIVWAVLLVSFAISGCSWEGRKVSQVRTGSLLDEDSGGTTSEL